MSVKLAADVSLTTHEEVEEGDEDSEDAHLCWKCRSWVVWAK